MFAEDAVAEVVFAEDAVAKVVFAKDVVAKDAAGEVVEGWGEVGVVVVKLSGVVVEGIVVGAAVEVVGGIGRGGGSMPGRE